MYPTPEWIKRRVQEFDERAALYSRANATNPFSADLATDQIGFDGEIPSATRKGVTYHVTVRPNERPSCTCPARTKYAPNSECSHIRAVRRTLENA
jgi:hypothetical protein